MVATEEKEGEEVLTAVTSVKSPVYPPAYRLLQISPLELIRLLFLWF